MKIKSVYGAKNVNNWLKDGVISLESKNCKIEKMFNNSKKNPKKAVKDIIDYIKCRIDDKYQLLGFFRDIIKNDISKTAYKCIVDDETTKICYSYCTSKNVPFSIRGYDWEIKKFIRTILNDGNWVRRDDHNNIIDRSRINVILGDSCMSQSDLYKYLLKGLKISGNKHVRYPEIFMKNWRGEIFKPNGGIIDLRGIK